MAAQLVRSWLVEDLKNGVYEMHCLFNKIMSTSTVDQAKIALSYDNGGAVNIIPTTTTMISTSNSKYLIFSIDAAFRNIIFAWTDGQKGIAEIKLVAGAFKDQAEVNCGATAYTDNIRTYVISLTARQTEKYEIYNATTDEKILYLPKDTSIDFTTFQANGNIKIYGYDRTSIADNVSITNDYEPIDVTAVLQSDDFEGVYVGGVAPNWAFTGTGTPTEEGTIVHAGTASQELENPVAGDYFEEAANITLPGTSKSDGSIYAYFDAAQDVTPTDGDFETWPTGWTTAGTITQNVIVGYIASGTSSASFGNTSSVRRAFTGGALESGKKYALYYYAISSSAFKIRLMRADNTYQEYTSSSSVATGNVVGLMIEYRVLVTPNDSDYVDILFYVATGTTYLDNIRIYRYNELTVSVGTISETFEFTETQIGAWVQKTFSLDNSTGSDVTDAFTVTFVNSLTGKAYLDSYTISMEEKKTNQGLIFDTVLVPGTLTINYLINKDNVIYEFKNCNIPDAAVTANAGGKKYLVFNKCTSIENTASFLTSSIANLIVRYFNMFSVPALTVGALTEGIAAYCNTEKSIPVAMEAAYNSYSKVSIACFSDNDNVSGVSGITLEDSQDGTNYGSTYLKVGRDISTADREAEIVIGCPKGDACPVGAFQNAVTQNLTITGAVLSGGNKIVTLTTTETLTAADTYRVIVNNVEDTSGNIIEAGTTEIFVAT